MRCIGIAYRKHSQNDRDICVLSPVRQYTNVTVVLSVLDMFTDSYLKRIIQKVSCEQEQRLQSMLDMDPSDIKKLSQLKDRHERILEMVNMWLRRTHNPNKTQLAGQLKGYFKQITYVTPTNGEWLENSHSLTCEKQRTIKNQAKHNAWTV